MPALTTRHAWLKYQPDLATRLLPEQPQLFAELVLRPAVP